MNNEYEADLITLTDEDGTEYEFEILDSVELDDKVYYALMPTFESPEDAVEDDGIYYIFEAFEEDGEPQLAEVEDEELLDKLADIFETRYSEMYEEDGESVEE